MPKFQIITNIPSPYRVHLFTALDRAMQLKGVHLQVLFMAASEQGRYWHCNPAEWSFDGVIVDGLHPSFHGITFHFNSKIWLKVLRNPPDWLLVGGGWHIPTSVGLHFLHDSRTYRLMWVEANHWSSRYRSGIASQYRHWALNSADALVIPGQVARETLDKYWQVQRPSFLYLPNLVDEMIFRDGVASLRKDRAVKRATFNIENDRRVLFWSARLIDRNKGILNFLNTISDLPLTVLLAGDGEDRHVIEQWKAEHPSFDLRILGHVNQSALVEYMALADVAVLPSFRDPNPLSLIEAIWAGLPMLVSDRCGNSPETVRHGVNGWLVDPSDHAQLRNTVEKMIACSSVEFMRMGQASLEIAQDNFDTERSIAKFIDNLLKMLPPRISI